MPRTDDTLLRAFAGVLLGYVALTSAIVLFPRLIHSVLSFDDLFQPASFAPTPLFIALILCFAAGSALVAGYLCRMVARNRKPVLLFAAIIGIMCFFTAIFALTVPNAQPQPRTGSETLDVVQGQVMSQQPTWVTLGQPVLVVAGILIGGSRRRLKSQS